MGGVMEGEGVAGDGEVRGWDERFMKIVTSKSKVWA